MTCVSILQISLRQPPFSLGSGTLTPSAFTGAGSLSAVFTHITGVKRSRFHNEVQPFMGSPYQDAVRIQKPQPFPTVPGEISGVVSTGWCQGVHWSGINSPEAVQTLPTLHEMCGVPKWTLNMFITYKDWLFSFTFSKEYIFSRHTSIHRSDSNLHKSIHSAVRTVIRESFYVSPNSAVPQLSILTRENFLLAYWSAVLPSDSSQLIRLILSRLFWWDSTELTRPAN